MYVRGLKVGQLSSLTVNIPEQTVSLTDENNWFVIGGPEQVADLILDLAHALVLLDKKGGQ